MSEFTKQMIQRFEDDFRGYYDRIEKNAAFWQPHTDRLKHRVIELVCMDGRVPPIMPHGLSTIVPVAGAVPVEDDEFYQAWMKKNCQKAKKKQEGILQLVQLHTECAAFCRQTDVAVKAAKRFVEETKRKYGDRVQTVILLYSVVHGGVKILDPEQDRWYELALLGNADGTPNLNSSFFGPSSTVYGNEALVADLGRIAFMTRHTRQRAGDVVQQHSELALVIGDVIRPWRGCARFLSYRSDLVDVRDHKTQFQRATEVVRGSLRRNGHGNEPLCFFVVTRETTTEEQPLDYAETIRQFAASMIPDEQIEIFPYIVTENNQLRRVRSSAS